MRVSTLPVWGLAILSIGLITDISKASPVSTARSTDLTSLATTSLDSHSTCLKSGFPCNPYDENETCCSCNCRGFLGEYVCIDSNICDVKETGNEYLQADAVVASENELGATRVSKAVEAKAVVQRQEESPASVKSDDLVDKSTGGATCLPDESYCTKGSVGDKECCSGHCMYTMWYGWICADTAKVAADQCLPYYGSCKQHKDCCSDNCTYSDLFGFVCG